METFVTPSGKKNVRKPVRTEPLRSAASGQKLFELFKGSAVEREDETVVDMTRTLNENVALKTMTLLLDKYAAKGENMPTMIQMPAEGVTTEFEDFTPSLYKLMNEDTYLKAADVKEYAENLGVKYATQISMIQGHAADVVKSFTPKQKTLMVMSLMIWAYFSSGKIEVPTMELEPSTEGASETYAAEK